MENKKGFYLFVPVTQQEFNKNPAITNYEYFLISDRKNITNGLKDIFANKIANTTGRPLEFAKACTRGTRKAILKKKVLSNGLSYIDISGDNFGGCGDENTIIFTE